MTRKEMLAVREITKAEYEAVKARHVAARGDHYHAALYVHKDAEGRVWNQTYSHPSHGIPTVEACPSRGLYRVLEVVE